MAKNTMLQNSAVQILSCENIARENTFAWGARFVEFSNRQRIKNWKKWRK